MKKIFTIIIFVICTFGTTAQKINGQWHGFFNDGTNNISLTGGTTEYVLELFIDGNTVSGTSYTYFEGKKFYVICNLNGTYDKRSKRIVVNETERVKGSTPLDWSDCLQTHVLYYGKEQNKEVLSGEWKTSPYNNKQNGGCGWGATTLSRRLLNNSFTFNKKNGITPPKNKAATAKAITTLKDKNKPETIAVAKADAKKVKSQPTPPIVKNETPLKKDIVKSETAQTKTPVKKPVIKEVVSAKPIEKRNANIVKTIEVEKETFKVDLYDNGDVDGDTISLLYNGKLVLAQKRLTDKALSINLAIDDARDANELVMYAENLGSIPPNTAVMVITDGDNRYEVRIASDLQKSGTIRFIHKPKSTQ
jgi:hypothetical protein